MYNVGKANFYVSVISDEVEFLYLGMYGSVFKLSFFLKAFTILL